MDGDEVGAGTPPAPPARVSLVPISPSTSPSCRLLSSRSSEPSRPFLAPRKQLAWLSLQGRLVGTHEATSARAIGGGLSREEAAAWELFSPLHRVLIVAVVAVAATHSRRSQRISQLQRSVDLRDQLLLSMQQKLDDLCEQMNSIKDQSVCKFPPHNEQFATDEVPGQGTAKFCSCGHRVLELNPESGVAPLCRNSLNRPKVFYGIESGYDEMFKATHVEEQEERRMSDLSDFCSSVTSSVDIQLSTLAAEQDLYNLRKECEEKDATIKKLAAAVNASSAVDSKRILELEEIIRRKNMVITRLKKDMVVLEQKLIQLMRLQRPSSATSNTNSSHLPVMMSNLLYDMSSTSPSSSDSDSPAEHSEHCSQGLLTKDIPQQHSISATEGQRQASAKSFVSLNRSTDMLSKQRSASPLQENRMIQRDESTAVSRPRRRLPAEITRELEGVHCRYQRAQPLRRDGFRFLGLT